jgi:hypothetical protein
MIGPSIKEVWDTREAAARVERAAVKMVATKADKTLSVGEKVQAVKEFWHAVSVWKRCHIKAEVAQQLRRL